MIYKKAIFNNTSINENSSVEGISIERKLERVINSNEPIDNTAPIIYTERKEGVLPQYDVRTDRFDIAMKAMDKVAGSIQAKRENKGAEKPAEKGTETSTEKVTE